MSQSIDVMLGGGLIRLAQGFAAAAPTFLIGLLVASILRYYLGHSGTKRLFGGDQWRSMPQSWLIGMLLPVCSLGVLPILREMRRAGVKPGALSAFALSAPLFNPLSLLYGLTLSRPIVILLFAFGSLIIVTALGLLWDAIGRRETKSTEPEQIDYLIGIRRLLASMVYFCRELVGANLGWALLALSGLFLLAMVLPFGAMQNSVERDDWWAPTTMLFVAIPVYASPMLAMSQLGMMFQHANSPGAAFVLLILGAGMNLATPVWFARHYGVRAAAAWTISLLVIVLGIAYAVNRPLIPPGVDPAGHTHAFDIYANPLSSFHGPSLSTIGTEVSKNLTFMEIGALVGIGVLGLVGLILRGLGVDEASLVRNSNANSFASSLQLPEGEARRGWDIVVPPSVIGVTMLIGLVAMSMVACYAYYPSPRECLEEIKVARGECLSAASSGNAEHALFWLPVWEDWSRRLEVGTFLRYGEVRPYQRMQGYLTRKKLELLEHELEHDPLEQEELQAVLRDLMMSHSRWAKSFQPAK